MESIERLSGQLLGFWLVITGIAVAFGVLYAVGSRLRRLLPLIAVSAIAVAATLGAVPASAACQCVCMNGSVEAVCSSSIDVRPVCPPRVCPIVPPSVRPIDPPRVPPVGTTRCRSEQVWNGEAYEWVEICR